VYVFRNVVDLRRGTYKAPPVEPDPTGAYLDQPTTWLAHNHGSPTLAVYYVYHNTFLLPDSAARGYYAWTWGTQTRGTTRRVFNNIFAQERGVPGLNFTSASPEDDFQADGNLLWGRQADPQQAADFFTRFRGSPQFQASKRQYAPGWGAHDQLADPRFVSWPAEGSLSPVAHDRSQPLDLRLKPDSPAIDAGVPLPSHWPDPLRQQDTGPPDIGAYPLGVKLEAR
jgi:hypothetical protein